ncbi:hypothetical protein QNH20_00640 [Neobacillus sp. WH10]|nr:hypothetical protein [Neobacillus sp. WH10]WHY77731.1 hypothetical protein QNH20_00640 [Neobacillus sp. WH10]
MATSRWAQELDNSQSTKNFNLKKKKRKRPVSDVLPLGDGAR